MSICPAVGRRTTPQPCTVATRTAPALSTALEFDEIDLLLTGPAEYVVLKQEADALPVVGITRPGYRSMVVTRADSDVTSLADLADKTVITKEVGSTSGHLGPLEMLADAGLVAGENVDVVPLGATRIAAFGAGEGDALVTGLSDFAEIEEELGVGSITMVAEGPDLPNDLFVARSALGQGCPTWLQETLTENQQVLLDAITATGESEPAAPMISVRDLSHRYPDGTQALSRVSLSVAPGEAVVLLGHDASGKSTLITALTRLIDPTEGTISVAGTAMTGASARSLRVIRRSIGTVFQSINLVDQVSVLSNVLHGGLGRTANPRHWFGWAAPADPRDEAMECLRPVGLAPFAARRADQLSGGQRQRVAIARMLMQRPAVVLADEPVAALDPPAGREVMDLLWQIVAEENLTLMCTLHQLQLAEAYGDRIVALQQGAVVLDGRMRDLSRDDLAELYTNDRTAVAPDASLDTDQHPSTDQHHSTGARR